VPLISQTFTDFDAALEGVHGFIKAALPLEHAA